MRECGSMSISGNFRLSHQETFEETHEVLEQKGQFLFCSFCSSCNKSNVHQFPDLTDQLRHAFSLNLASFTGARKLTALAVNWLNVKCMYFS